MVLMSRPLAGVPCRIRIPVRQYEAVALIAREGGHVIRLLHRDQELSVDVEEFEDFVTAAEYRDRMATFLDLPALMLAGSPSDAPSAAQISHQKRHPVLGRRRARFLARRRSGELISLRRIEGAEIIARN
jgi:hypothetical protein